MKPTVKQPKPNVTKICGNLKATESVEFMSQVVRDKNFKLLFSLNGHKAYNMSGEVWVTPMAFEMSTEYVDDFRPRLYEWFENLSVDGGFGNYII